MRREFLKRVLAGTAAWTASPKVTFARNATVRDSSSIDDSTFASAPFIPILQGATTSSTAQFSILVNGDPNIQVVISYVDGSVCPVRLTLEMKRRHDSPWIAYKARAENLLPGKAAFLEVFTHDGVLLDRREFSALKDDGPRPTRFVLASCMNDAMVRSIKPMWDALEATRPDFIFMLGDCVYVDSGPWSVITPERIWRRYVETRLALGIYRWKRLVPTLATWDDHDFGKNDKDSRWGMKDASRAIFDAMYAQEATSDGMVWEGPGISRGYRAYGHRFILMDGRSFRSSRWAAPDNETFWGVEQDEWLESELNAHVSPAWILNGTQYFGGYRSGLAWSFEGNHSARFREFIERMRRVPAPVVLGSGDVHFSEVQALEPSLFGYGTYEITSSAMHSFTRTLPKGHARRLAGTDKYNFCLVDARTDGRSLRMDVSCIGAGSREYFKVQDLIVEK